MELGILVSHQYIGKNGNVKHYYWALLVLVIVIQPFDCSKTSVFLSTFPQNYCIPTFTNCPWKTVLGESGWSISYSWSFGPKNMRGRIHFCLFIFFSDFGKWKDKAIWVSSIRYGLIGETNIWPCERLRDKHFQTRV